MMFLPACRAEQSTELRPNIILVTIDTLRWDHTSLSGYFRDTTPVLTRLASEAVDFDTVYTPTSSTAPAHATMFSGLLPSHHGLLRNGESLPADIPVLPAELEKLGWRTSAVVSSFVLNHRFGWFRGFGAFHDTFDPSHATVMVDTWNGFEVQGGVLDQRADAATDQAIRAIEELSRDRRSPFFLWLHYFDPHSPYVPPPGFDSAFPPLTEPEDPLAAWERHYDEEILFTDTELGRFVSFLRDRRLLETTLLIVTSDHGEGFMEHGFVQHGIGLWEEFVRVPLLIRLPGGRQGGRRVTDPIDLTDLLPTIIDLLNLEWPAPVDGMSLRPFLEGRDAAKGPHPPRAIFLERQPYRPDATCRYNLPPWIAAGRDEPIETPSRGVRFGRWKFLENREIGLQELFDLQADPTERVNLATARADLANRLAAWVQRDENTYPRSRQPRQPLSDEDRAKLRALGYLN
jgi:arylsulfatase A-like enzyme